MTADVDLMIRRDAEIPTAHPRPQTGHVVPSPRQHLRHPPTRSSRGLPPSRPAPTVSRPHCWRKLRERRESGQLDGGLNLARNTAAALRRKRRTLHVCCGRPCRARRVGCECPGRSGT